MDLRTLFLAQTCALAAIAVLLWIARSPADRANGLRAWTLATTSEAIAYLVLSNARWLPATAAAMLGNAAGAIGVALYVVAVRRFAGRGVDWRLLGAMVLVVTAVGGVSGAHYAEATIFNGFAYAAFEWIKGVTLWRDAPAGDARVRRSVALCFLAMGCVLPIRALGLLADRAFDYLDVQVAWQVPIYLFGFFYIVVTNLGFVLMCKGRAEAEVRQQARTDELTGLANRRALDEAMDAALASAQRSGRPFAVMMVDLDSFKAINDRHGHAAGDAVLAAFARRLHGALRGTDRAFRYGGEEFCVLLPDTGADSAAALAERVRAGLALPGDDLAASHPTASFGIAVWRADDAVDALFRRADQALYRAKAAGRDRVEIE